MDRPAVAEEVLSILQEYAGSDLARYGEALTIAFANSDPVFTRPKYHQFFFHCASTVPNWLAQVIVANAEVESHGSAKLASLWQALDPGSDIDPLVMGHARDESRHARLFLELARLAFQGSVDLGELQRLDETLPDVRREPPIKGDALVDEATLVDHMVQMNLGEIRTRIHVLMIAPVLHALTPSMSAERVAGILTSLVRDEVRHIAYTATVIDDWARDGNGERLTELLRRRLRDLHVLTVQQTEAAVRSFGAGRFPELLEMCYCHRLACPFPSGLTGAPCDTSARA